MRSLEHLKAGGPSVVTIGVFDGMHLGHQAIMRRVNASAKAREARAVVITFDRNPQEWTAHENAPFNITTLDQKLRLIESAGIDLALVLPVDESTMSMPAGQFIQDVLCGKLDVAEVIIGSGFAFGRGREGNERLLAEEGRQLGFEVMTIAPEMLDGIPISSTAIRGFISAGDVERAEKFLGHPYVLEGMVVHGDEIGRTIGYPTANIKPAECQILPANGVYAALVLLCGWTGRPEDKRTRGQEDGKTGGPEASTHLQDSALSTTDHKPAAALTGVVNIGTRPTIGTGTVTVEVYIIDFSGNIYDRQLEIAFRHRLRREMKFSGLDALKAEITRDVERVKREMM